MMQGSLSQSTSTRAARVSLGPNHGYRFEGDIAILSAELALGSARSGILAGEPREHWALQLWACEQPHHEGPLRGIKVAEAEVDLSAQGPRDRVEAAAFAQLPPVQRDYVMVLVLASGSGGRYDQVHDFFNYPERQRLAGPHLAGSVGYRLEGDAVVLQADWIVNARAPGNLSGSLSLELWALSAPYAGGAFEGVKLGETALPCVAGQGELRAIECRVPLAEPPAGDWHLTLMLREWTARAGFVTRDFCNFHGVHHVAPAHGASASEPHTSAPTPEAPQAVDAESTREAVLPAARPPDAKEVPAPIAPVERPRVSVQTASVEELARVEGLNKKLAQAIVRARPLGSLDELLRLRGIGPKVLKQLRASLTL